MGQAVIFGIIGSSALVLGAALGSRWHAPPKASGNLLAFASGTLFGALAFELLPKAVQLGDLTAAAAGLLAGAAAFVAINGWVDSRVARHATGPRFRGDEAEKPWGAEEQQTERLEEVASGNVGPGVAFALLAAVTLDGVPENLALGVSLLGEEVSGANGGTIALLVAIFTSNFPEALVGAVAMRAGGRSAGFAIGVWTGAALLLAVAAAAGYALFTGVGETALAFSLAFAGGAVLASLADTLMPEAFERGRPFNSFSTVVGFFLSFVLATL